MKQATPKLLKTYQFLIAINSTESITHTVHGTDYLVTESGHLVVDEDTDVVFEVAHDNFIMMNVVAKQKPLRIAKQAKT